MGVQVLSQAPIRGIMKSKFSKLLKNVPLETKKLVEEQNKLAAWLDQELKDLGITRVEFAQQSGLTEEKVDELLAGNASEVINEIKGVIK